MDSESALSANSAASNKSKVSRASGSSRESVIVEKCIGRARLKAELQFFDEESKFEAERFKLTVICFFNDDSR